MKQNRLGGDLLAAVLAATWLLAWRAILGVPWGLVPEIDADGLVNPGILFNASDTWSDLSWVMQYTHGANLAGLQFTTEPHAALLWLFPLWLVGKLAALVSLPPLGLYNAAGLFSAMLTVVFFRRAAGALGLGVSARSWTTFALLIGSGGSWLWHLASHFGLAPDTPAPELLFFDLFPATALLTYAYHAMGLALLTAVWWLASELENRLCAQEPSKALALMVGLTALLLSFSRPYEPLVFFVAWMMKAAWHGIHRRREPSAWRASLAVGLLLTTAFAPGLGWAAWVSTRPVWSTFAGESLALNMGLGPLAWGVALSGWLVLAALGLPSAWRTDSRRIVLPVAATVLLLAVLILGGAGKAKLASGLMLGPAILSGWGLTRIVAWVRPLPALISPLFAAAVITVLLGVPSLAMSLRLIVLQQPPRLGADFIELTRLIPISQDHVPLVLADEPAAGILPGLIGARVWAGHFSLTYHYKEKIARLRSAGLDPDRMPPPGQDIAPAMDAILADAPFEYAIMSSRCSIALAHLAKLNWIPVQIKADWILLRSPIALTGSLR